MPQDRYLERVRALCGVALRRLPEMVDDRTGLVLFRVDGPKLRPAGTSVRYTAMTALGLERAESANLATGLDAGKLLRGLDDALPSVDNSGDLGLVLWAAARRDRALAERALGELVAFGPLTQRRGGTSFHSTELGWVVTGLCEALAEGIGDERIVRARLDDAWKRLLANRGDAGLLAFATAQVAPTLRGRLRAELGFFDAQVYAIVASLRRYEVLGDDEALGVARTIGRHLLRHQRDLGQWAWHYNARTGELVDLYPVYSVHQDGMAPMALIPLERLADIPTRAAIAKGVEWLFSHNELGASMVNTGRNTIWRSIRRRAPLGRIVFPLKAASLAGVGTGLDLGTRAASPSLLEVDHEFRPYHLGWCLFAFSELAAAEVVRQQAA